MRSGRFLVAGPVAVLGLLLIGGGQVIGNRHSVEDGLANASAVALDRAGVDGVRVAFTGRDAELTGPKAELGRAAGVVLSVDGVRTVHVTASQAAPAASPTPVVRQEKDTKAQAVPTALPTASLKPLLPVSLIFQGRTITVSGQVPSKKVRSRVMDIVRSAGASVSWKATDRMTVVPDVTGFARPEWYPGLARIVQAVPTDGKRLVVRFDVDRVTLRGHPSSADVESSLLEAAKTSVIPPFWVQDGLDVTAG